MVVWKVFLDRARAELARGNFSEALRGAESLLSVDASERVRGDALLVAADAAYAMGSYRRAGARYGEFLSRHGTTPEAARAAMAVGWVELRQGHAEGARWWWTTTADRYAADTRAPVALVLAAEVARRGGDMAAARASLDRVIAQYPSTPSAGTARLTRSILAMHEHREDDALRDLDELIMTHGASVVDDRQDVLEALADPAAEVRLSALATRLSHEDPVGVVAIHRNERLERVAVRLAEIGERQSAPSVLHGLVLLGVADNGWSGVVVAAVAHRLVETFPAYPAAPALLTRIATSAASVGQTPVARRAYEQLLARYPDHEMSVAARVGLAEILVRAGAIAEARVHLERALTADGHAAARALLLLAELELALGNRRQALAAYDRLLRDHPEADRSAESLLSHARLLADLGEPERARPLLHIVVDRSDATVASEAAYRLARIFSAAGEHEAAVEWYMTAAYVAEDSDLGRHALLDAGSVLAMLNRTDEALIVYRKLMPALRGRTPHDVAWAAGADAADRRRVQREAAYQIAQLLRGAGHYEEALDMYLSVAHGGTGSSTEGRALLGALECFVAMGDRAAAEAIYHRMLLSSETEPAMLARARKALRATGRAAQDAGSKLPGSARR